MPGVLLAVSEFLFPARPCAENNQASPPEHKITWSLYDHPVTLASQIAGMIALFPHPPKP